MPTGHGLHLPEVISGRALVAGLLLGALASGPARGDELRLRDGEILHGGVRSEDAATLVLDTPSGPRRVERSEIAERIEGPDPREELERRRTELADAGPAALGELAAWAWAHRLDDDAQRLAERVLEREPDDAAARRLLGHVRGAEGWIPGFAPPHPPAGRPGPRWGDARARLVDARSARAVDRALAWLAAHQEPDGRLDADGFPERCPEDDQCTGPGGGHHGERVPCAFDGVTTALAALAWSAAGNTPVSGPYADNLARALGVCRAVARRGPRGFDDVWNHAFATRAVADALLVRRDPGLLEDLERAVRQLESRQLDDGGWSYVYGVGDVPTTAAVLRTLGLAAQAGVGIHPDRIERALRFLDLRVDASSGRSEYHDGAERKGYTPTTANAATALAARAMVGRRADAPHLARQLAAIRKRRPRWKLETKEVETADGRTVLAEVGPLYPYAWDATTVALERGGGAAWRSWQRSLQKALLDGQIQDGHARGSWDPLGPYSLAGGRIYVTALCALMLQAPCRLP